MFRLRKYLGLGVLYACLGLFQFVQVLVFILNTVYDSTTNKFLVSPGSSVFITITLFSLLIIYLKEDAKETKKMIFAILIVNVLISWLLLAFGRNMNEAYLENNLLTPNHFIFSPRIQIFGNIFLFLDSFLLIIIFEYISKKIKHLFFQIFVTMVLVVSIDTILFSITTFWNLENLSSIITNNLLAKNSFTFYYSILFYFYIKYLDIKDKDLVHFKVKDVFKPLSYKQKFETAVSSVKKSEEMYRLITDNATDIISLLDLDGKYQYVSPSIKNVLGYNQSDFIDETIFSIVHPDDIEKLKKNIKKNIIVLKKTNNIFTIRLLHKKGFYVWIEFTISPIYKNSKFTSFVSSARNITERVLANNQFKTSLKLLENRERALLASSKIGKIGFIEFNNKTNTYTWSDYLYTIFGLETGSNIPTQEEFLNYFEEKSKIKLKKCVKNLEQNGIPFDVDSKIINTKKEELWLRTKIEPIFDEQNKIVGRRGIVQDITEFKNTQLTLEQNNYSLTQTSRIAKIGYWEYDIKSKCFTWSNYVYKIYGLDPKKEIPSRKEMINFYDEASKEKYKTAIKNLDITGKPYDLELKIINNKNEEVWVRVVVQLVINEYNQITGRRGIIQNITENKIASLQLEKSNLEITKSLHLLEQKERSLKESRIIAKLGYSEYIFETKTYVWSDYMYLIYGVDPNQKTPTREEILALHDDISLKKLQEATKKLDKEGTPYDLELKLTNFNNEEIWVRIVGRPIYNDNNEIIGRSGIFRDITNIKNSQLKLESYLKQLEAKDADLKESNRIANIGYWEYKTDSDTVTCSHYVYKIYGLDSNQKIPSQNTLKELYDKESLKRLEEATIKLINDGKPYDIEIKLINFKNEEIWTRNIVQPIYNDKNEIIGRRGVIQNITAYKKTQLALENSLHLLEKKELALIDSSNMAGIGYIEYDYATNKYTDYSEYIYNIFGLKPGEELTQKNEALFYFDEESKIKYLQSLHDVKNGKISDIELKGKNRKQEDIWIRSVSSPIYNDNNEIVKRRVVLQDIRNYKVTQQELQETLHLLKRKDLSLKDSSRIAGIGYVEYSYKTDSYETTEYVYKIFGIDIDKNATQKEIISFFDKESQIKYIEALEELQENGTNYDIELKGKNKKNEEIWIRSVSSPIYNDEGTELIGRRIVIQDIKNYKNIQLQLEKSKQKIQNSLDLIKDKDATLKESNKIANIGYWELDLNTNIYTWSEYVYKIFGLDAKQKNPSRKEILKFYDQNSKGIISKATQELNTHGVPYDLELRLINANNEEIWTRNVVHLILDHNNKVIGRRGLIQNITAYKKAQLEIKKSLTQLEKQDFSLKESSRIAKIGHVDYNSITNQYIWSDYTYTIFGLKPTDKIPSRDKIINFFDKESQEKLKKVFNDINEKGLSTDIELKGKNKNNETIWIRQVAQPVYNDHNILIGRRALLQDITTYKINQLQLENSKKEIQNSLNELEKRKFSMDEASKVAKIGYFNYDIATGEFYWSDYLYEMYDYDPKNTVVSRSEILKCFDEASKQRMKKATDNLNKNGVPYDIEIKITTHKNNEVWIRNVAQPVYNEKNEIIARRGVSLNITTAKKAQIELELSKERIQNSLKEIEKSKFSMDQASKVAKIGYHKYYNTTDSFYWSEYMFNIFGLIPNQKIPTRAELLELFHEKSRNRLIKANEELETYGLPYDLELKLTNLKKQEIWIRMSNQPIYNKQKTKIVSRGGVAQDITERKKIEEEHLKTKNDYIRLFDNATISIWNENLSLVYKEIEKLKKLNITNICLYLEERPDLVLELIGKINVNYVNKATLKLFKANSQQDFFNNINLFFGKDADKVFIKLIEAIWNDVETFTSEVNYKTLEGDQFIAIFSVAIPKTIEEQKTVPISIQSIQSIKDAEIALKETLKTLNEAQKLGHIGNWELNTITDEFTWSDEVYNILDFNPENGVPKKEDIFKKIHPDDVEFHNKKIENAIKYGNPFNIEIRFKISDSTEKTIKIICKPIKDNKGKVICLKGVNQDITEQKKILKEIEKTQEMYRLVTDYSNDLICLHDINGKLLYISPSVKTLLGYDNLEQYDKSFFEIIHYDEVEMLKNHIQETSINSEYKKLIDFRARHLNGHFIWFEALTSKAYKEDDTTYFVTIARDITEYISAKQEIEEYQKSLQKLTTEITVVEENQKKEIATNIHDHLSQALVISNMKIKELKLRDNLKITHEELNFIEDHISNALANSRKITSELSPPILYQLGIIEALYWLLETIEVKHKIKCEINDYAKNFKLNDTRSILLYRSIQEILNNTIKYAKATLITIDLHKNDSGIDIIIMDNGKGFDVAKLNNLRNHNGSGFGLFTVKERIKNIKGNFKITSKINKGTTVNIFIPLADE
ncbi:hypothetical protein BW723_16590 [Polaribacter reichenbachii]|uniref:histidine kinase n=1 Tax=Polaribacter reichenbachii TaxID=996801 RepID=A0A1B8TRI9_9FLAO|nr:hypothetical protein BW723_16590 [Polaribacter reichenbachii]AUC18450.1 hypothetical protein BTO17_07010 [Polaribacter reichenbachii]OBY62199.1 hypothetical protein LPB301_15055 [Polaribacter reichenbachii]